MEDPEPRRELAVALTSRERPRASPNAGASLGSLVGVIAAAALALTAVVLLIRDPEHSGGPLVQSTEQPDGGLRLSPPQEAQLAPLSESGIEVGREFEWKQREKKFDGNCTISGIVEIQGQRPFPDSWRLIIEPSRLSIGREFAERREVEFGANERTFEEIDLPMGGYSVDIEADGFSCRGQEVLLFKLVGFEHLPGKNHAHLMMKLLPAGWIDGAVVDTDGLPVSELPVILEDKGLGTRQQTTTNISGMWRFDEVVEGSYRLLLGNSALPLIEPLLFGMVGEQLRLDDLVVPRTGSVRIRTLDESGAPLGRVRLRGYGRPAGTIEVVSAADGTAQARFLPEGSFTVRGEHASGLQGVAVFEVDRDLAVQEITLQLKAR